MNIKKYICLLSLILGLFSEQSLMAQIEKKAQVGFRFLENPVSAEVVGRGAVGVTTTFNSNGIFWNPGLLGMINSDVDVSLNHTKFIADINYNAAAATFKLGSFGVIGVSLLAMDYGTFYGTYRSNAPEGYTETGTFSPTAMAIGVAFSQKMSDRFSYGIHIKYIKQDLGTAMVATAGKDQTDVNMQIAQRSYSSSNLDLPIALDVGAIYDFNYAGIKFAASLQNISREFKYESEQFPMPFMVNFGVTIEPLSFLDLQNTDHKLILSAESQHPRDFGEKTKFGAEYTYMNTFIARVGYMGNYDERGATMGLGIKQEVSGVPFRVDYAYEPFGIFGGVHFLSLGISY